MTQRQLKTLNSTQAQRLTPKSLSMIFERNRINSPIVKKIFLEVKGTKSFKLMIDYFVEKVQRGDVGAQRLLNRMASEKFNKNELLRNWVLEKFRELAFNGDDLGLKGLLSGVKDSSSDNRNVALWGLRRLATYKGDARVLPGLIVGARDSHETNRWEALRGLGSLVKRENAQARYILLKLVNEGNKEAKQVWDEVKN
jgi:hypothetical protein